MTVPKHCSPLRLGRRLAILLALPLLVSCGTATGPSDVAQDAGSGTGTLSGSVFRGPVTSVVIEGSSASIPVAGARMIVSEPGGGPQVGSTVTDAEGRYRLSLPSGSYLVTLGAGADFLFTKDLPATVTVGEGQTTTLDVKLDTGIR